MKYLLSILVVLNTGLTGSVSSQTIIKIPFTQKELFVVEPRDTSIDYESGEITLGETMEIHGGSGQFSFTWSLNGAIIGNQPVISVMQKGDYTLVVNDGISCEAVSVFRVGTGSGVVSSVPALFRIFPNPVVNVFYLQCDDGFSPDKIKVFNLNGKLTTQFEVIGLNEDQFCIDASLWPAGQYLIEIESGAQKRTRVLLKQN